MIVNFETTYEQRLPNYEQLRTIAFGLIQNSLKQNNIDHLSIQSRVKSKESALEKSKSRRYSDPIEEITDFVALRVIVFLDRDVDLAAETLRDLFRVDPDNSIDKRMPEKVDTAGYRSLHLVCTLGPDREHLEEYRKLVRYPFEVQIRTSLQHAWAEIEHKRRYKGSATLPKALQHRLMALSGTLELVDREFSAIATEAEEYVRNIQDKSSTDTDRDALSEIAIAAIYDDVVKSTNPSKYFKLTKDEKDPPDLSKIQNELIRFGINSVGDLRNLLAKTDWDRIASAAEKHQQAIGIRPALRTAMMLNDTDKYFDHAYNGSFESINIDSINYLESVLQRQDLKEIFDKLGVTVIPF